MATADSNDIVNSKSSRKNMTYLQPAPPGAPPNLQRAASRYITVEPVLLLTAVGFGVAISVLPQFLRYTVAIELNVTLPEEDGGINGTCVGRNRSNPYYVRLQEVQAEVAYWQMVISMCGLLPAIIVTPPLGAWSDIVGRKVIIGLTGSNMLMVAQCTAYISDVTNKDNRLLRIALTFTAPSIGIGLTQVAIGYLIRDYGFGPALWMTSGAVGAKSFSLCLPDLWNLQVSMVFAILFGYLHAYVNSTLGLYMAALAGSLRAISGPLIPAMLAKLVSDHEHGVVFAFKASIESIGSLLSPLLLNSIYRKTVQTQPNFVFIMMGTLSFIPLILTAILQVITRYAKKMERKDNKAAEKEGIENKGMVAMGTMTE
ncbi:proton-coupled folate transporter-like [Amphiura filiformis]|uniref:proton-coupled folate transporter-like n=1 Tax=Amphiura filiformis TaxID=82378 RepID=UPI003B21CB09